MQMAYVCRIPGHVELYPALFSLVSISAYLHDVGDHKYAHDQSPAEQIHALLDGLVSHLHRCLHRAAPSRAAL
jgi:hypothetical protein